MSEWQLRSLEDFVSINPRESLAKGTLAKKIGMEYLQPFVKQVSGYQIEEYKGGTKFRNGDTLVARITPCLENGKTAYVNILDTDEVAFGSTEYIVLRELQNVSDKQFIYYFSRSEYFRDIAIALMTGSSGRQRVQTDSLSKYLFEFPPLPEQKAIADVLSALDDKIDLLQRQNETLEKMAETLFRQWFIEEAKEDWEEGDISQLIDFQNGYAFKSKDFIDTGIYHVIKIKNISGNIVDLNQSEFIQTDIAQKVSDNFLINSGDVLVAMTGAEIGKLGIVPKNTKYFLLNQRVGNLKAKFTGSNYLAYLLLKSEFGQDYIINSATGSAQPNISSTQITSCLFPKIEIDELIYKSKQINVYFEKIVENMGQVQTLQNLRDTLLPKLMSGEVRVKLD